MRPSAALPLDAIEKIRAGNSKLYRIRDIEVRQAHVPIPVMFLKMSSCTPTQDVSGMALAENYLKAVTEKP
jgi:hypothetical protein